MKLTANYPARTKQSICRFVEKTTNTTLSRLQEQCNTQQGFSYIEVLVAMFIIAIALVPAMEALQSGIQGAGIHQQTTQQHYLLLSRMENLMA
ncbi:MAG: type II secretion system protein, partial [Methylococcales bacterium]|nr:type II secretion system protein [Methylococcales bacterium]